MDVRSDAIPVYVRTGRGLDYTTLTCDVFTDVVEVVLRVPFVTNKHGGRAIRSNNDIFTLRDARGGRDLLHYIILGY